MQLVHHDDVATAIALAATAPVPPGANNIAGNGEVKIADVANALGGRPVRVPATAASAGSAAISRLPFVPSAVEWLHVARTSVVMDTGKTQRQLGWRPTHSSAETLAALAKAVCGWSEHTTNRDNDPVGHVTARRRARHLTADHAITRSETLAVEEPLEIRVNGTPVMVTMRTPGSDIELAQGFLLTEGVIGGREDVQTIRYCGGRGDDGAHTYNVLDVTLAPGVEPPGLDVTRNFYTTSSCGVCGKASLDAVRVISRFSPGDDPATVTVSALKAMPGQLRGAQKVFDSTGGLHGAALFSVDGAMFVVREDIGRHNAVDKVIGWAVEHDRIPLSASVLLVSGRASFELTQKALLAGIPVLAAVSAPSSLAVSLAEESGITLVAFLREDSMNVYTRADRITH